MDCIEDKCAHMMVSSSCRTDISNSFISVSPLRVQNPKKNTACYPVNRSTSDPIWDELVKAINDVEG